METAVSAGIGFIVGTMIAWFQYRPELRYLRDELKVAHAQIAHAVLKEGAQVPPRVEDVEPVEPLPVELQSIADEWEDPESRMIEEMKMRKWLADGWAIKSILRQYTAETN